MESVRSYQERERAAQKQKAKDAASAREDQLVNDASSPATKPANPGQVNIVEFFDYRCGYCKRVNPTVSKFLADHPNVRLVFKEFPILGPESVIASKAALAAQKQGKYLAFHQAMMTSTATVNASMIEQTAKDLGMDLKKLKADMESPEIAAIIAKNTDLASALDINATPSFVVGSEVVSGAIDQAGFEDLISKAPNHR